LSDKVRNFLERFDLIIQKFFFNEIIWKQESDRFKKRQKMILSLKRIKKKQIICKAAKIHLIEIYSKDLFPKNRLDQILNKSLDNLV
jgi:hypothetical protein